MGQERLLKVGSDYVVIPVLVEPGTELPSGLSLRQAVDLAAGYSAGMSLLAKRLDLEAAMATLQARLLAEWDAAFSSLRRHADVLRGQLNRMRLAVDHEEANANSRAGETAAASAEVEKLRKAVHTLQARARENAALADAAEKRSERASADYERARSTLVELKRRLVEVEASHQPVLAKIDQAGTLLEEARRDGPLSVTREGDVASLLENPSQLAGALDLSTPPSFASFQHEHTIRGLILDVVLRTTERHPDLRDAVLASCAEAFAREVTSPDIAMQSADAFRLDRLSRDLVAAIDHFIQRKRAGLESVDAFEVATRDAFARLGTDDRSSGDRKPVRAAGTPRQDGPSNVSVRQRFDLVITGIPSGMSSADKVRLAQRIHDVSKYSEGKADVDGYFAALKLVTQVKAPFTVLRDVREESVLRYAKLFRSEGVEVLIRDLSNATTP